MLINLVLKSLNIEREHRIEEVKMMDKYTLDLLLEKSAYRNKIYLSYDRNTQIISWANDTREELEKQKEKILKHKRGKTLTNKEKREELERILKEKEQQKKV